MSIEFPEKFNLGQYFLYHNLEAGREDKTCLYYEDQTFTYGDACRMANRTGNALRELGVELEDRILIALPDSPEFVWSWFGAARIGAVITMVNPLLPAADYPYYLEYTRARVAIIAESLVPAFTEASKASKHLRGIIVVGDIPADDQRQPAGTAWFSFNDLVTSAPDECAQADTHRDDIAIWLFTSGSTGNPKGAVHLQHDLPFNTGVFAKRTIGVKESDLTLAVPKLFFGYATGSKLLFPFSVGAATALFSERSTPAKIYSAIECYRPTILTTVPTMINAMLNANTEADLSSLRFCYSAGEALPVELYERWKTTFGVEIYDGIGSAEMFHIYISNRPGDVKPGSLGKLVNGYEARIVGPDGAEVATGEMGTLRVRGDSAALCYWNAHEESKKTFAADWCTTGDQFHVDEQGYYWYHGRADDMLKVSGVYVAPTEIENCLLQCPSVLECAVIGHDDGDGLIKPKAFIVLRTGETAGESLANEIKEFVKARLALYKYPRWIEFVSSLPKNDRGKINRKELKARDRGEKGSE